mgnify:CR=1 FL=1
MFGLLVKQFILITICFSLLKLQIIYHEMQYIKLSTRKALRKRKMNRWKKMFFGVAVNSNMKHKYIYYCTIIFTDILILEASLITLGFICVLFRFLSISILGYFDKVIKISGWISLFIFSLNSIIFLWDDRMKKW